MNTLPFGLLYTQDTDLVRRLAGTLHSLAVLKHLDTPGGLDVACRQFDPVLVMMDLRAEKAQGLLAWIRRDLPQTLVVALAVPRSDPALRAAAMGVYAVEDPTALSRHFQAWVRNALAQLELVRENRLLKQTSGDAAGTPLAERRRPKPEELSPRVDPLSKAVRNFENTEAVLNGIVEGLTEYAKASRAGIFAALRGGDGYRLRSGVQCLEATYRLEVAGDAPLVRWMLLNAHPIARVTLGYVEDPTERLLLRQSLDALGAEVIVPLHGRQRILGWVFVGRPITGSHFGEADLLGLTRMAEQASTVLENALLYEEVALQRTLAETVLHAMPEGIVAIGDDLSIRWYNSAAERILGLPLVSAVGQPPSVLGGRLAGMLMRCLRGDTERQSGQWVDAITRRSLSVEASALVHENRRMGAMAIVHDVTQENLLTEKQGRVDRASFWTELAAAISHEVRNPLVAISTFAQLLPERYSDPEFRAQFSQLATSEIHRLNAMVDQITAFANPPELVFVPLDMEWVLTRAVETALKRPPDPGARVESSIGKGLPKIRGDEAALRECFAHLVVNALEAAQRMPGAVVRVMAEKEGGKNGAGGVHVTVQDNAGGIPASIRDRVFSPFCSSKARGIGLGLPIAKRTVTDHNGSLRIETGDQGTIVHVTLPAAIVTEAKVEDEAYTYSR